ncbi:hypothetical protein TNIN_369951 [Trichonephila inaurata madagascariensis]|uniref:Uncharacterized protein n=1 Tax=Trichonephila inaurata madagascariensis TaxID=2747483 RepID=A0A8X7BXB0_9ARAC|nr:hypothetical protein TNIN_369951 [Trichonephila inaurata madagascariensis]
MAVPGGGPGFRERSGEELVTSPSPRQRRDGNAIGCRGLLQMPPMRMRRSPVHLASGESVSEDGKDGFLADAPPHALRAALAPREGRQPITWPFHSTREDERLEHEGPAAARRAPALGDESPCSLLLKTLCDAFVLAGHIRRHMAKNARSLAPFQQRGLAPRTLSLS